MKRDRLYLAMAIAGVVATISLILASYRLMVHHPELIELQHQDPARANAEIYTNPGDRDLLLLYGLGTFGLMFIFFSFVWLVAKAAFLSLASRVAWIATLFHRPAQLSERDSSSAATRPAQADMTA